MRRLLALALLAAAAVAAYVSLRASPEASAVAPSQVIGVYRLKLKGDGWLRGSSEPYRAERVGGGATLILARSVPDDGRLQVEIRLDPSLAGGLVDLATPEPAFRGSGFLVGDSLSVIDTGGPTYVNAFTLTFLKDGSRVAGHWVSAYAAAAADAGPASGVGIEFSGKRTGKPGRLALSEPR